MGMVRKAQGVRVLGISGRFPSRETWGVVHLTLLSEHFGARYGGALGVGAG